MWSLRAMGLMAVFSALILASTLVLVSIGAVSSAQAYDDDSWMGWSNDSTDWAPAYDRSAARKWELNPPLGYPTVSRDNIQPMLQAIKRYARIVAAGGWQRLPRGKELRSGMSGPLIVRLRKRLRITGDLKGSYGYQSVFDSYVREAVRRFQKRHGLTPTGFVDKKTILALNVPATARLRQLRANLARMRNFASKLRKKYVLVNIPAAQVETVENNKVVSRHSAVVGKISRQSPYINSTIYEINFNPYWNVPRSIVRKDLVPKARQFARRKRNLLLEYHMSAYDSSGRKLDPKSINWFSSDVYSYHYKQSPWKDNSMGFVKINFHNKHDVFMHDTPTQSLFGRNYRAYSSGCVRIQNIQQVIAWLLKDNDGEWNRARVSEMKRSGERLDVRLKKRVGVYFVYITAWATPNGTVNFRRDIYRRDGAGIMAASY